MNENKTKDIIDLSKIIKTLREKKKIFVIMWPIVFALSCLWIFPEPRYYNCNVKLAPEGGNDVVGGLASIASDFGFNIGAGATRDAIYPTLYPDLFESPEFLVELMSINIETEDGDVRTDYYTYMKKHQKKNWLTEPFKRAVSSIKKSVLPQEKDLACGGSKQGDAKLDPFNLSKKDAELMEVIASNIKCSVDKKTDVISISVKDQDRLVCALLADSVKTRLQAFIIDYRTKKVREDEKFYKHITDSAYVEYYKSIVDYAAYMDGHRNSVSQSVVEQGVRMKNSLDTKLSAYNAFNTQYQTMKAKVQERTPSFTTLKSATVPQKPAGPKRMMFVVAMLVLSTVIASLWIVRKQIFTFK